MSDNATLVVGVGSHHGDDRLGWLLADGLQGCAPPGVSVRKAHTPVQLFDWLPGVARLYVVDACRGSGRPGELQRFTWPDVPCQGAASAGTHDLGLIEALRLADALGQLPPTVVVWGVTVACATPEPGAGLSAALEAALPGVLAQLLAEWAPATDAAKQVAKEPAHA